MTRFILKRLVSSIIVLLIIITAALWITRLAPSNPCLKERESNTCACVTFNDLDRPVFPVYLDVPVDQVDNCQFWQPDSVVELGPVKVLGPSEWGETQYFIYVKRLLPIKLVEAEGGGTTLDFGVDLGQSMKTDRSVTETLGAALPYTALLGVQALLLALIIGVPAGLISGLKQNTATDYTTMTAAMVGVSIPNFVLGPILILIFALNLGWFRPNGWDAWVDSILPTVTLALYYAAYIARLTRGGMLEIIRKDFIRTARAKGLSERLVVLRHSIRGAILPVVSYLGPAFAAMLTGSVVVEEIFNLPGVGTHFVRSALNRDYNLVLGTVILYSTILVGLNLLVDILYTVIDPRVDYDD